MTSASHVVPDLPPLPHEVAGFKRLARLRKLGKVFLITFLSCLLPLVLWPLVGFAAILSVVVLLGIFSTAEQFARCPRCGECCFPIGLRRALRPSRCINCQTKLYWTDDELAKAAVTAVPSELATSERITNRPRT
jgi:hypothetical protein